MTEARSFNTAADGPRSQGQGERQRAGGRGSQGEGERQRAGGRGPEGEGERQRAGGRGSHDEIAITFSNVTRRFGQVVALADVSLAVRTGEFVALIGPSGCGKSTMLRLASGLDTPTAGTIACSSDEVGYVFQDPTLMPWRSVRRNVELFAQLDGMDRRTRAARVDEVLETVGLTEFADHKPRQLSGGMRMRASLARSLVLDPELFLFDEPFGALDQITRIRLNVELMQLFADRRFAALFVTHSVDEAVLLSSRIVVLSARPGRITAEFDVPFEHPRSPDLRYEPAFGALAGQVADALKHASGAGPEASA